MIRWMARVLLRGGVAMLILCLLVRPAIHTASGLMGDNLAIIACLLLMLTAALYIRFGPKDDADEPVRRWPERKPKPDTPRAHLTTGPTPAPPESIRPSCVPSHQGSRSRG